MKRLLLFCAGIILGLVAVSLLLGGAMQLQQGKTWFSGYYERIIGLNLIVQGVVVALVAALGVGRAIIPLKSVPARSGTTLSGPESGTIGGGPVLPICAIPFLYSAFVSFLEQTERTFGILCLIVGGLLLGSPLFLKRRVWQLGWRINGTGIGIAIGGLLLSGMALFVQVASGTILHRQEEFYSRVALLGVLAATIVTVLGGVKAVAGRTSPKQSWYEGANYPSPVRNVLVFGYYDGPTNGVLQCADGQVYCFDLLAWEPDTQDVRVFGLSPLAPKTWEQLAALCDGHRFPWPEQLRQSIEDILGQAGPVEWVMATEDLEGEILRVKALHPGELARITNWGAFLGLAQELPARASR